MLACILLIDRRFIFSKFTKIFAKVKTTIVYLRINKHINKITMANLNLNDSFINVRYDEVATIIRLTNKTAFLSCKSEYGTFEIKKSINNIINLVKTGQWELINTK